MTLTGSSGIIEFLGFLHVAPNMKEVSVTLNYEEGNLLAHMTQSVVGALELLLNNLECVNISELQGNNDEEQLVAYMLKNVTVLNELLIEVYVDGAVEDENARVGKSLKFYNRQTMFNINISLLKTKLVYLMVKYQAELTVVDSIAARRFESRAMTLVISLSSDSFDSSDAPTSSFVPENEVEAAMKKFFVDRNFVGARAGLCNINEEYGSSKFADYMQGVLSYHEGHIEGLFTLVTLAETNKLLSYTSHLRWMMKTANVPQYCLS
ncbi:F-box/LRR-repeat protein 13 [Bienertia sinuspersici]